MKLGTIIHTERRALEDVLAALRNRLTAEDNLSPDGEAGQVLMSNGENEPPSWQDIPSVAPSSPGIGGVGTANYLAMWQDQDTLTDAPVKYESGVVSIVAALAVAGVAVLASDLTVNGNTVLGDATSDTIVATARFASDLIPSANNTRSLGTLTGPFGWLNLVLGDSGVITVGTTNPATAGQMRLRNNASIQFRNAANSANIPALAVDNSNNTIIDSGAGAGIILRNVGFPYLTFSGATATFATSIGAVFATTGGYIQFGNTFAGALGRIRTRNNDLIIGSMTAAGFNASILQFSSGDETLLFGTQGVRIGVAPAGSNYWRIDANNAMTAVSTNHVFSGPGSFTRLDTDATATFPTATAAQAANLYGHTIAVSASSPGAGVINVYALELSAIGAGSGAASVALNITNGDTRIQTVTQGLWRGTTIETIAGGTGLTSYNLGDILYASAINTLATLAGNTSTTTKYLTQTGTGAASAAPVWSTLSVAPSDLSGYGAAGGYLRSDGSAWVRVSGLDVADLTGTTLPASIVTSSLTTIGTLVAGAVPASLVTAGTFGAGAYTFPSTLDVEGAVTSTVGGFNVNTALAGSGLQFQDTGVNRVIMRLDSSAQWVLLARGAAGAAIDAPIAITLASGGTIAFSATRPITGGTYNGQTISSAASFTGTLAVAGTSALTGRTMVVGGLYVGTTDSSPDAALQVGTGYTYTTAANLFGIRSDSIFPGTATGQGFAGYFRFRSANTAFTMTAGYGVRIETPVIGAASTITTGYGLHINSQTWTGSTNAYGIYVGNVSGASGAAYGLRIFDQTGSGVNYALYTGAGLVRFGDRVDINASITAAAGAARALYLTPTLTASANGDNMTAVSISPTFSVGGFTGTVVSGLNIGPITGGATNYAIRVANPISSTLATGTAPFSITSTTVCTNLNADLLDDQHGSYYNDAANLTGTVASARIAGSYTGITGVGTLAAGAIPASLVTAGTFGTGDYTFDSNIVLSATNAVIRANTADGSDSHSITIAGGGGTGNSRGGYIKVYGNESAVFGDVEIISGNASGSDVTITAFGQIGLNGAVYVNGTLTGNGIVRANTELQTPSLDTIGATDLLINRNNVLQLTIGSLLATFAGDVTVASGKVYKVNGTQVVAARITGYTNAMTGTADRATSYDTSTITLQQLAERVKALEDDLTTHGLIGA